MISNNASEIAKELQDYVDEVESKLKAMVIGFAGEVALAASVNTPVASEQLITRWQKIYENRQDDLDIDIAPGFHAGSWKYKEGAGLAFDPKIYQRSEVRANAMTDAKANYRVGDTFSIEAEGPNFDYIVKNNPVKSGTENMVLAAYATNVKRYYDQG